MLRPEPGVQPQPDRSSFVPGSEAGGEWRRDRHLIVRSTSWNSSSSQDREVAHYFRLAARACTKVIERRLLHHGSLEVALCGIASMRFGQTGHLNLAHSYYSARSNVRIEIIGCPVVPATKGADVSVSLSPLISIV
jgi:hypothetical protein